MKTNERSTKPSATRSPFGGRGAGPCRHRRQHILVIGGTCTCEVTVRACRDCGKYLTEPETDC